MAIDGAYAGWATVLRTDGHSTQVEADTDGGQGTYFSQEPFDPPIKPLDRVWIENGKIIKRVVPSEFKA